MTTNPSRVPAGAPTGGQFAPTQHGEPADVSLGPSDDVWSSSKVRPLGDLSDDELLCLVYDSPHNLQHPDQRAVGAYLWTSQDAEDLLDDLGPRLISSRPDLRFLAVDVADDFVKVSARDSKAGVSVDSGWEEISSFVGHLEEQGDLDPATATANTVRELFRRYTRCAAKLERILNLLSASEPDESGAPPS